MLLYNNNNDHVASPKILIHVQICNAKRKGEKKNLTSKILLRTKVCKGHLTYTSKCRCGYGFIQVIAML
jgi:hypothetical protein